MKGYQTDQKRLLLSFLEQNCAHPLTIEEISRGLNGASAPGKSTVYRLMNQLVQEGKVRRSVKGNSRHFVYQLIEERCHAHLHCRCVNCGKLYHLDEQLSVDVGRLLQQTGFALDRKQTTLFGTCQGCGGQYRETIA